MYYYHHHKFFIIIIIIVIIIFIIIDIVTIIIIVIVIIIIIIIDLYIIIIIIFYIIIIIIIIIIGIGIACANVLQFYELGGRPVKGVKIFYVNSRSSLIVGNSVSVFNSSRTKSRMCDVILVLQYLHEWCGKDS